jgi:hypothetical protein
MSATTVFARVWRHEALRFFGASNKRGDLKVGSVFSLKLDTPCNVDSFKPLAAVFTTPPLPTAGPADPEDSTGVFSFNDDEAHPVCNVPAPMRTDMFF